MYVQIDMSTLPPSVELRDADDLSDFRIIASVPSHMWLDPDTIANLAGRSGDTAWNDRWAEMVAHARENGWVDTDGRVRAHVQVEKP